LTSLNQSPDDSLRRTTAKIPVEILAAIWEPEILVAIWELAGRHRMASEALGLPKARP
jgi:hypothetical protein